MRRAGFSEIILLLVVLVVGGIALWWFVGQGERIEETTAKVVQRVSGDGFNFDPNTPGYDTYRELLQGCPVKDCIPSIDKPQFESVADSGVWLADDDVVFAMHYKGESKAYPQRILNWHEIVNDEVAGDSVAITFCPLCGSALAFDRTVDGPASAEASAGKQVLEFGVSGKLHNNDLVIYDRQTDSLWQQITGEAIVGELLGKKLKQISMDGMRWKDFKGQYPDGRVLSRNTGFERDYDVYPYGSYEQDRNTLFPLDVEIDQTIHPKTVVYGVEINGQHKAYPEEKLREEGSIEDVVGGVRIRLSYYNGDINVMNLQTKEEVVATRLFWFAWKAFYPESDLY